MEPDQKEREILALLDTDGGFTTADVARRTTTRFGHNGRTHSAFVRSILLRLEAAGLVTRLDDQKPVCWLATDEGMRIAGQGT